MIGNKWNIFKKYYWSRINSDDAYGNPADLKGDLIAVCWLFLFFAVFIIAPFGTYLYFQEDNSIEHKCELITNATWDTVNAKNPHSKEPYYNVPDPYPITTCMSKTKNAAGVNAFVFDKRFGWNKLVNAEDDLSRKCYANHNIVYTNVFPRVIGTEQAYRGQRNVYADDHFTGCFDKNSKLLDFVIHTKPHKN